MTLLADWQIEYLAQTEGMIDPFINHQVRQADDGTKVISYGLSSYGYDIRLGDKFKVFTNVNSAIVDPKNFDPGAFVDAEGPMVVIPSNSFILGYSFELINMPRNVTGVVVGKSTMARCGLIANVTPLESGWVGHITIEISNTTPLPARIYANEGIAQVLFFMGEPCQVSYADRGGKYQGQGREVTLPKV